MAFIRRNPLRNAALATLLLASFTLAPTAVSAQQQPSASHEHSPFSCDDVPAGTARPAYGCFNIARVHGLNFRDSVVYWFLYTFPTRSAAEAAKTPTGVVVEEDGKVWLNELASVPSRAQVGTLVSRVGPLVLPPAPTYTAIYSYAVMAPGQRSRVHTHPGPEGWYVLAGEQCLETSVGVFRGRAAETVVVPGNVPMELYITGSALRRALVVVVHDSRQPRGTPSSWSPPGACRQTSSAHTDSTLVNTLAGVDSGRSVRLATHETRRIEGNHVSLVGDSVFLNTETGMRAIAAVNIDSVWVQRGTAALLVGIITGVPCALFGAMVGGFIGGDPDGGSDTRSVVGAFLGLLGGGFVCGSVGAGIGSAIRRWQLEYPVPADTTI
jgi:quercetin dioxygenase-like cupin family protein